MRYMHLRAVLGDQTDELQHKTVTIVGLGGIGSALAGILVRSGVGVRLVEKGRVEDEDMDRLSLFSMEDVGKFKATVAKKRLNKMNPDVTVKSFNEEVTPETLFLLESDVIVETTGDPDIARMVSEYAFSKGIPCAIGLVRDRKCIVSTSTDKKDAFSQLSGLKVERTIGLLPNVTRMVAGFLYTKTIKFLLGIKPKRGVVVYDVWEQQFEDKRGNKK